MFFVIINTDFIGTSIKLMYLHLLIELQGAFYGFLEPSDPICDKDPTSKQV